MPFAPIAFWQEAAAAGANLLLDLDFTEPNQQSFTASSTGVISGSTAEDIWLCDETSGNLVGEVNSRELAATGSVVRDYRAAGFYDGTDCYSKPCYSSYSNNSWFAATGTGAADYLNSTSGSVAVLIVYRVMVSNTIAIYPIDNGTSGQSYNVRTLSGGTLRFTFGDGTSSDILDSVGAAADGAWHCTMLQFDRTANLARLFHDFDTEQTASISGYGDIGDPSNGIRFGRASSNNVMQVAYIAAFTGGDAEISEADFQAFWTHAQINTTPTVTYSRSSAAFSDVGSESGFGVRVAGWTEDNLPVGHNSGFSHASKLGASFYDSVTNLVTYSYELGNAAWTKTNVSAAAKNGEAPDGSRTATKLTASAANGYVQSATYTVAVNDDTTASAYIRRNGAGDVTGRIIIYDVSGAAEEASTAFTATSEWQRFRVHNANAASTSQAIRIEIDNNTEAIDVWGVQAEEGIDTVTPYIPTTSAAATRSDPACTLTNTGGNTYYKSDAGELAVVHLSDNQMTNDLLTMVTVHVGDGATTNADGRQIAQTRFAYETNSVWDTSATLEGQYRNTGSQSVDTEYEHRLRWDDAGGLTGSLYHDSYRDTTSLTLFSGDNTVTYTAGNNGTNIYIGGTASTTRRNGIIASVRVWDAPRDDTP